MATIKTWIEKLNTDKKPQLKHIEVKFADIPANSKMFIATPLLIDQYIRQIPKGEKITLQQLRKDLAIENKADYTCPVTTGIYLRIVAEASYEKYQQTKSTRGITPFWRAIELNSPLSKKLSFGQEFIIEQLKKENNN